jgi:hypothetical protein
MELSLNPSTTNKTRDIIKKPGQEKERKKMTEKKRKVTGN